MRNTISCDETFENFFFHMDHLKSEIKSTPETVKNAQFLLNMSTIYPKTWMALRPRSLEAIMNPSLADRLQPCLAGFLGHPFEKNLQFNHDKTLIACIFNS